ncbi:fibronectin type III domain-containing protein [Spirosoma spitsbergense]|uniref:fibronectin type III domain-containing protein n=1 Tax=Spirosoma spitsbergense TaxID=431554 RepID=UPI00036309DF|nr:fibronectin type III domain-containing protein [Spirosoma spitsbergense]
MKLRIRILSICLLPLLWYGQLQAQQADFNQKATVNTKGGAASAYPINIYLSANYKDNGGKGRMFVFEGTPSAADVKASIFSRASEGIGSFFLIAAGKEKLDFYISYGYDHDDDSRFAYDKITYTVGDYGVATGEFEQPLLRQEEYRYDCNVVEQNCRVRQQYSAISVDRSKSHPNAATAYTKLLMIKLYVGNTVDKTVLVPITVLGRGTQFMGTGNGPIELITILRTAPGDQSYTYWQADTETSNEISTSIQETSENSTTNSIKASVGIELGAFEGGEEVETTETSTVTKTGRADSSYVVTYTTSNKYTNREKSDLFIAEQHRLDWGLEFNLNFYFYPQENYIRVFTKTTPRILFHRGRLVRPLQYTEAELLSTVIPELEATNNKSEAKFWREVIAMNNRIKANAPLDQQGVVLTTNGPEVSFATTKSSTQSYSQEISLANSKSTKITASGGVEIGEIVKASAEASQEKTFTFTTTNSLGNTKTSGNTKTIGYQIADNQFGTGGDKVVYDLRIDGVYGTPIFVVDSLKSKTSCPYEPGTTPRDQLSITVKDPVTGSTTAKSAKYSDQLLDAEVTFNLTLKNNNKDEARAYKLSIPFPADGLLPTISVPGISSSPVVQTFTIPKGGTQALTLKVKNSFPEAKGFRDIQVRLESDCDDSVSDSVLVSVFFGDSDTTRAPDNDLACNAIAIPADGSLQTNVKNKFGTFSNFTNRNATSPPAEATLTPAADCDTGWCPETTDNKAAITHSVWFTFVAKTPTVVVSTCDQLNDAFDSQMAAYQVTNCNDLKTFTLIAANDNGCGRTSKSSRLVLENLTVGTTYYVMVDGYKGAQSQFGIRITSPVPANDNSCRFEYLTVNGKPNQGLSANNRTNFHYSTYQATADDGEQVLTPASTDPIVGWKADSIQHSVWFSFAAPDGGEAVIDITNATFDAQVSVFGAGNVCGPDYFLGYVLLGANDDISLLGGLNSRVTVTGLTAGKRYQILVDGYKGAVGTFDITVSAKPPVNDDPCNAITLKTDGIPSGPYRNGGATTSTAEQPLAPPYNEKGLQGWTDQTDSRARVIEKSIWFKFVAPSSGSVKISTCNMASFQAQLALYQVGNCADVSTFKYLTADDNSGLCPAPASSDYPNGHNVRGSSMTIDNLLPDSTYYIMVDGGILGYGNVSISITVPPAAPPVNDEVCKAIALPTNGVVQKGFTNVGATVSSSAERALAPIRWNDQAMNSSVWFTFVAPASGEAEISLCDLATFDTQIAVYASTTCTDFNSFSLVAANEDGPRYCATKGDSFLPITGLTPGTTYYLVVDGYRTFTGNFDIVIKDKITPGPENDDVAKAILLPVNNVIQKGYTNILATATKLEQTIKPKNTGDCVNGWCDDQIDNSVWFRFVAPADGIVNVSTCDLANFDTQLAVYTATDVNDFGTFTLVGANDAGPVECATYFDSYLPLKGLKPGQTYYVMVDGFNGDMGKFDIALYTSPDTQAPTAPTNLTTSATTATSTKLTWAAATDNIGVTGYKVYVDSLLTATITETTYSLTGLTAATSYSVYIVAVDAAGNATSSSKLTLTTLATPDTQAPTAPTSLTASDIKTTSSTISWTASTDNVGVKEYRISVDAVIRYTTTATTYSLTGLTPATTYTVYVTAADAAGNQTASTAIKITTLADSDTQAPTAPTNLTATAITTTGTTISWTASTDNVGITGYKVYLDGNQIATSTATTYSLTGLTPATAYSIYVVAVDAAGNASAASTTFKVTTSAVAVADTQAPTAPTNLTTSATTTNSAKLTWTAATDNIGVTQYRIYLNSALKGTTTETTYSLTGLTPATVYSTYVVAADAAGNASVASTTVTVSTVTDKIITSIDEPVLSSQFDVFPNPSREVVTIKLGGSVAFPDEIELRDLHGSVLPVLIRSDIPTRTVKLDLTDTPTGMFIIVMKVRSAVIYKKIIKY